MDKADGKMQSRGRLEMICDDADVPEVALECTYAV